MPYFYILRVVREDNPLDRAEVQVKFYPLLNAFGEPVLWNAEDELDCAKTIHAHYPFHHFAIQEKVSYDRTVAGLVAKRILRNSEGAGAGVKTTRPIGFRKSERHSGIPEIGPSGPPTNQTEAQLAF